MERRRAENWLQHKSLHAFTHTQSRSGDGAGAKPAPQHPYFCVCFTRFTRSKPSLSSRNGRSARVHTTYVWTYPRHWSGNVKICPSPLHDCSAHVWMYLKQAEINSIWNKEMVWDVWGKGVSSYTDASLCFLEFIHLSCTQLASILDGELYLVRTLRICLSKHMIISDHSGYGFSQWEEVLLSNAFSHWLSPYPEWNPMVKHKLVVSIIDIDNVYSTYSNWLHIVFMQHNHLKKKII